jgi:hypothetical protein
MHRQKAASMQKGKCSIRKSEETHDLTNLDKEVLIESRNPTGPLQLVNAAAAAGGGRAPEEIMTTFEDLVAGPD